MMNRENYRSCVYFDGLCKACKHPGRRTWPRSDMDSCSDCAGCPLDCAQATGRPDECPYGLEAKARGMNALPAAEGGAE